MALKKFNPITPGQRYRIAVSREELTKGAKPEKSLLMTIGSTGGRNSDGRRTMRYRGGGHKRRYRIVDFRRDKTGEATVQSIQYDPNRSAYLALITFADGEKSYIIAPEGLEVGQTVQSGRGVAPETGNCMYLAEIPLGAVIHNIEMHPGQGGVLVRSAGNSALMMGKEDRYAVVKLPSGETRRILMTCRATIGSVSNPDHSLEVMGKAGRMRWKGWRPRNRPVAMNPVDHPMGGGEGRASGGHPRSRKGLKAKGAKTRNRTKASNALIISRKKG
ncbi:MAG: 50S ribosomal protein L2 [Saprospiraceae bacterium]|nr:50S ribosomal protein L2 [Saprospiraceae bacterium]MCB0573350.1 50S ribosomal protein L2 [Saprospiraceae bacterium]MCB9306073.1 50S ribosomal protein L2 [Lewinellaceae bacterium]MCB9356235.1 50S ribosomal protein L2 [Lewinellaceae bacterium]